MNGDSSTPKLPVGLPADWVQNHDVFCPHCRYNLRMLRIPRCPECGLVFRWQTLLQVHCPRCNEPLLTVDGDRCARCDLELSWEGLLEDARHYDRKLFEYSDRPIRAVLRAAVTALAPARFWSRIRLETPPVVGRLRRLRRAAIISALLGCILLTHLGWMPWGLWNLPSFGNRLFLLAPVMILPLVTFVGLPRFTPTLARFNVRRDQLLRCTAYGSIGLLWMGFLFTAGFLQATIVNWLWPPRYPWGTSERIFFSPEGIVQACHLPSTWDFWFGTVYNCVFNIAIAAAVVLFGLVWWWVFLYVALRRYLRLNRTSARALFVSTQAIGLLIVLWALLWTDTIAFGAGRIILWLEELFT